MDDQGGNLTAVLIACFGVIIVLGGLAAIGYGIYKIFFDSDSPNPGPTQYKWHCSESPLTVKCKDNEETVVDDSNCAHIFKPSGESCPTWNVNTWVPCTNEKQTRIVQCMDTAEKIVEGCPGTRPASERSCGQWVTDGTCLNGETKSTCILEGKHVDDEHCDGLDIQIADKHCNDQGADQEYTWTSPRCSDGPFEVLCQNNKGVVVPDSNCNRVLKPPEVTDCPSWTTEEWSPCNEYEQTRNVRCHDNKGKVVSDQECTTLKPSQVTDCPLWKTQTWSNCSDHNKKTREVWCKNAAGKIVEGCSDGTKPISEEACEPSPSVGQYFKVFVNDDETIVPYQQDGKYHPIIKITDIAIDGDGSIITMESTAWPVAIKVNYVHATRKLVASQWGSVSGIWTTRGMEWDSLESGLIYVRVRAMDHSPQWGIGNIFRHSKDPDHADIKIYTKSPNSFTFQSEQRGWRNKMYTLSWENDPNILNGPDEWDAQPEFYEDNTGSGVEWSNGLRWERVSPVR